MIFFIKCIITDIIYSIQYQIPYTKIMATLYLELTWLVFTIIVLKTKNSFWKKRGKKRKKKNKLSSVSLYWIGLRSETRNTSECFSKTTLHRLFASSEWLLFIGHTWPLPIRHYLLFSKTRLYNDITLPVYFIR